MLYLIALACLSLIYFLQTLKSPKVAPAKSLTTESEAARLRKKFRQSKSKQGPKA